MSLIAKPCHANPSMLCFNPFIIRYTDLCGSLLWNSALSPHVLETVNDSESSAALNDARSVLDEDICVV